MTYSKTKGNRTFLWFLWLFTKSVKTAYKRFFLPKATWTHESAKNALKTRKKLFASINTLSNESCDY
jgi:hypothetical protein